MVTVNSRSKIFGFPNAAGLAEQTLDLLDQRLALEWVRGNIAKFGGNPFRIIGWDQSGGAIAVDYLSPAYPSDPIYSGMILDSSTTLYSQKAARTFDLAPTNFTAVGAALGCDDATWRVDCLREVSWRDIEAILSAYPILNFLPVADNDIVFINYKERYSMNTLSSMPALIGTNQHEFSEGVPTRLGPSYNQSAADRETDEVFFCTAARTSHLRQAHSLTTYRYRYDGNFSNLSPPGYPGAHHASELLLGLQVGTMVYRRNMKTR